MTLCKNAIAQCLQKAISYKKTSPSIWLIILREGSKVWRMNKVPRISLSRWVIWTWKRSRKKRMIWCWPRFCPISPWNLEKISMGISCHPLPIDSRKIMKCRFGSRKRMEIRRGTFIWRRKGSMGIRLIRYRRF